MGCLGVLLIGGIYAGRWFITGGQVLAVQTGSMRPVIQPGDAVLVRPTSPQSIKVGSVVTYRLPTDPMVFVTHRVIAVQKQRFITRGDAENQTDPPVHRSQLVGQVQAVAPQLGRWQARLRTPAGLVLAVYVPCLAMLYAELRRLYCRGRRVRYQLPTRRHNYYRGSWRLGA